MDKVLVVNSTNIFGWVYRQLQKYKKQMNNLS